MKTSRTQGETIAEDTKKHLIDMFASAKYGRREDRTNKYLRKGNIREQEAITLVSRINKKFYKKNEEWLTNEFVSGTLDCFLGLALREADETLDTKCSWSLHTFLRSQLQLDPLYEWQGHGYMWLSGAKKHTVAFCLVNGTGAEIRKEKLMLFYQDDMKDEFGNETPLYIEKCKQIERNHIFDMEAFVNEPENMGFEFHNDISQWTWDIPKEERVFQYTFDRDEIKIGQLKAKIRLCRNWMNRELFKI